MNQWIRMLAVVCSFIVSSAVYAQDFDIYVSDAGNQTAGPWQILQFDGNGQNGRVFTREGLSWPQDILFLEDRGEVLISNFNTNVINRHDSESGALLSAFATNLSQPTRMRVGPDGLIYVLQWSGDRLVRRYQPDGAFVDNFTSLGVNQSIGMDWDAAGNFYVSSFANRHVRQFDAQGNDAGLFVTTNLNGPTDIWFEAATGDLLVNDWQGGAVKRFGADGAFKSRYISGVLNAEGYHYLPNGNLLIGNGGASAVSMYSPDGTFVSNLVESEANNLILPNAVILRPTGSSNGVPITAGFNDAWFDPATAGQGFFITVYPDTGIMFLSWFTFDTQLPASETANLGSNSQRWLTAQGPIADGVASLTISSTEGGLFDSATPQPTSDPAGEGTMTVVFSDCESGSVQYNIPSLSLSAEIPIQRVATDNVPLCEALAP